MRVLLVNSEYPPVGGGAGNASFHLAQGLARLGEEITVLTVRYRGQADCELQGDVRVVRAAGLRARPERSGALEQTTFMLSGMLAGLRLVRTWRPDVTLAFFAVPCGVSALFLQAACGIPYVVSLRGGDVPGFRPYDFAVYHRLMAPLIRQVWRRARAVVANSGGLQRLAKEFDSTVSIEVIANGVDLDRFAVPERIWEPARILFAGRVVYQKGLDLLLDALAGLRHLSWELTIAGDGAQKGALLGRAEALGIQERVRFAGWLHGEELLRAYRDANLFVFPSRHEGMPNAVLEAMAAGLPVVASRIAGNEELVVSGETGLLVSGGDVPALRHALAQLLEDGPGRARMGAAGRKRVELHYGWEVAAAAYHRLLSRAAQSM